MNHKFWPPNGLLSESIRKHFPDDYRGYAIDVGASDGVSVNTTWLLEKQYRWTVLSVEANPQYRPYLDHERAFVETCACGKEPQDEAKFHVHLNNPEAFSALRVANDKTTKPKADATWQTIIVPVRTVDQLLAKWEFPRLDVLCVDTEGTEVDVMNGCDIARWKPKVVVVECWHKTGPTHDYMKELDYSLVDTSADNFVYLRRKK
jgi:FkbM family methyltransferase